MIDNKCYSGLPNFGLSLPVLQHCPRTVRLIVSILAKTKAPDDLVLLSVLSTYSLLLQGIINVERPVVGGGPVSLFTLIIAESGERKSTVSRLLEKPISDFQKKVNEGYEEKLIAFGVEEKIRSQEKKILEKELSKHLKAGKSVDEIKRALIDLELSGVKPPRRTQIILEDVTSEALASALHEGIGHAGLISSEGASILDSRAIQDLPRLNKLWSAESISVNRKSSPSFIVNDGRITISIMSQPSAMTKFMEKKEEEAIGIGFLARFLVCNPHSTQGNRFINVSFDEEGDGYQDFLEQAKNILNKVQEFTDNPELEKKEIKFSLEAKRYWIDLFNQIESNLNLGGRFFYARDHGSKLAENIARIAALLSYIEQGEDAEISLGVLIDAVSIAFYFSDTYLRCFQVQPEHIKDIAALDEYLQSIREDGCRFIRKNKIRQSGPSRIRRKQKLDAAIAALVHNGTVSIFRHESGMVVVDLYPSYPPDHVLWYRFCEKNGLAQKSGLTFEAENS